MQSYVMNDLKNSLSKASLDSKGRTLKAAGLTIFIAIGMPREAGPMGGTDIVHVECIGTVGVGVRICCRAYCCSSRSLNGSIP